MAYGYRNYGSSNAVALPAKIKCNGCRQVKNTSAFSSKQQNDLAAHIRTRPGLNAATMPFVQCIGCTPQQVVELNCYDCGLDKGLDMFSRTQRRTPDHALCIRCGEARANFEPGEQEGDESSGAGSAEDRTDGDSDGEDWTIPAATVTASASGSTRGTYSSRSTGGVPLSNTGSTVGVSTASTAATSIVPGATFRSVTNSSVAKSSGGGKFAKVKAVPRKVAWHKAEEERRNESDDDSDQFVLSESE